MVTDDFFCFANGVIECPHSFLFIYFRMKIFHPVQIVTHVRTVVFNFSEKKKHICVSYTMLPSSFFAAHGAVRSAR